MTTQIGKHIEGLHEKDSFSMTSENIEKWQPEYIKSEISVLSFAGGRDRGRCCQLTIMNKDGTASHIQLTTENTKALRGLLNKFLKG